MYIKSANAHMYIIIVFVLIIAFAIYIGWGQHDDFSFLLVFGILTFTLYTLIKNPHGILEKFSEAETATEVDRNAYIRLTSLYGDVTALLQPKFQYVVSSFKGTAKVDDEVKYDDMGNEIVEPPKDEVQVDKSIEVDVRLANKFFYDLNKFDPGCYVRLISKATGKRNRIIEEEYPM